MIVPRSTLEWQRNMLKAFLSPLQVNAQGVNIVKDRQNNLPEANSTNAVFRAMEVSTHNVIFFKHTCVKFGHKRTSTN